MHLGRNRILIVGLAAILFVAAALVLGWLRTEYGREAGQAGAIGGPFTLVDQTGTTVTDETYRGKWLLVFFGFTYCPDICPTTLNKIAGTLAALGPDAAQVQPLFITVDPERDSSDVLKEYVAAFDDRIVGLTGSPEQISAVARAYRAFYQRVGDGSDYTMNHSTAIYVMDPDGRYSALLRPDLSEQEMAKHLRELL